MKADRKPPTKPTTPNIKIPELLSPAGNWECAKAAVENGADAIYFGLEQFNARMRAQNITTAELPKLMQYLHLRGVKGYVTLNTLIFPQELTQAEQYLRTIIAAGVDAVIVQDIGICRLIRHLSPDFPIHASTQMTITSIAGVEFAKSLGCELVVLARECSIKEIEKIQKQLQEKQISLPLEVFVHGALCVAYSGQCLTSEALGGRSANRGECAQACRMPYELIADGKLVELGDKKYLLSPQDLAGLDVLPELVKAGVNSLKIEGRLKAPEYVANVTRVYRQALDRISAEFSNSLNFANQQSVSDAERYNLEMAFSRGLYTGWFEGINNQELVHARFGKKRGVYLGEVTRISQDKISIKSQAPIKPGDGVVFDSGHPEAKEEGGRIYTVETKGKETILTFGKRDINFRRVQVGDKIWKTSDPELDKQIRQTFSGETPQFQRPLNLEIHGEVNQPLIAIATDELGNIVQIESTINLVEAHTKPLTSDRLKEQLGRLGNTPFYLESLTNHLNGNLMLPVSELNRLRREFVTQLEELRQQPKRWQLNSNAKLSELLPSKKPSSLDNPNLIVLVRNIPQLKATLESGISTIYCELENPKNYREAVNIVREWSKVTEKNSKLSSIPKIFVAPPRITKTGENWILQQVRASEADGYLVRNYDQLDFFAGEHCIGDFSLNVANGLTADYLKNRYNLMRLTASYDLNISQLEGLLASCSTDWFEVTIHQYMPMFHMEHCVFCAFLSEGTDYTNCGRPCEKYEVKLRDRTGTEHILQADAGCRNTLFNGKAQTGAEYVQRLLELGLRNFRIEFVNESPQQVREIIYRYHQLLSGEISGSQLWRDLKLNNQLGVTRGAMGN
ncbi:peptidase U32 [[Phormidium ambiguum] IAM M-71]|uniref:Peptidase U32 n=2 Tax=[Phormidium ambiguum] IAM M-71 TaxID=454136 RepID=A0A1U7IF47_9CYAN|nr:peptidase U32 [Phormidium ambiguum IAM M-71]